MASTRLLFASTSKAQLLKPKLTVHASVIQPLLQQKGFHSHNTIMYAAHQSDHWQPPSHPLMEQLARHPHIMEQLLEFTAFIQTKGIDPSGKQLNYMQVMKVMQDPEVKAKVQQLARDMQSAGIQLDMATIAELQKSLGQPPTTIQQEHDDSKDQDNKTDGKQGDGVINKVKGFFKK
ncbi:uncharacterized protein BX664DRAFT_268084 [Halteromyces radiatus]|uniref:uncharacterized protein n=1 Tax=Halteromyces radiatus TaxID=101107 RepID=UPI00221F8DCE|nr:uncharacterized protein BX664DRAFT_268084 [Halteromyces radiatus]KAI8083010.1 hypothetical protein BX664DRAFT_268084 [Halteromyces radiatus]